MKLMTRLAFCALLMLGCVFAVDAKRPKSLPHVNSTVDGYRGIWFTLGQPQEYGDKYSGGLGTYTMKHIPLAVYAPEVDKTFFVYGGTPSDGELYLQCMIGCFDHKTGLLQKPRLVYDKGQNGVLDPHDNPVVQVDKDGYVWVFVSGRGKKRNGIRLRSEKPYDITSFKYIDEDIMAYPQVHYSDENGFFLFFIRYDGKRQTCFQTSPTGMKKSWSAYTKIANIKEGDERLSGHYQITNRFGNKVVSAFNRHINGNPDTRTNIYFVQSEDWGKTWTTVDGRPLEFPLTTRENDALVRDYQSQGCNCYIKDVNFDKDGNPVILYVVSKDHITGPDGRVPGTKNGGRLWYTLRWNGKEWIECQFAESSHAYDSGSIWTDGKEWTIIAPTEPGPQEWGSGGEIAVWKSRNEGKTWKKETVLTYDSKYNHGYVRRPQDASEGFYAFWGDGHSHEVSPCRLYFCTKDGRVFMMPAEMTEEWAAPIPVYQKRNN